MKKERTGVITSNSSFHQCLHPLSDDNRFVRTEIVRPLGIVDDPETIFARVDIFIHYDLISNNINIAFNFGFLKSTLLDTP